MTIHAFTQPTGPLPAYINLQEVVSAACGGLGVRVTVRHRGENHVSCINLTRDQLQQLAIDVNAYLAQEARLGNLTANAGGVPYE